MCGEEEINLLLGLTGLIGSGKTTVAYHLCENFGFARRRFAGPLKDMLRALPGMTDAHIDGKLKEKPSEVLEGKTPRYAMQTLGTEWGRQLIGPNLWSNAFKESIKGIENVVVDDVRFPNEAALIKELDGIMVRILRPRAEQQRHESEIHIMDLPVDWAILNDMEIRQLNEWFSKLVVDLSQGAILKKTPYGKGSLQMA